MPIALSRLESWSDDLSHRCPRIASFYSNLTAAFWREVDSHDIRYAHREPDPTKYRGFVDRSLQRVSEALSSVMTAATAEVLPGATVARFAGGSLLLEGPPLKPDAATKLRDTVVAQLANVFPGATFTIQIEEIK